jgi:RNA polymerase sigma factor (sigma-70 family)
MLFQGQKSKVAEEDLLKGILHDDPEMIRYIYRRNFERIKNMVNGFKYISIEPEDVFQESLTRAIINVKRGVFKGGSTFSTYLYGISRNICLKDYEKNSNLRVVRDSEEKLAEETDDDYFDNLQKVLEAKKRLDEKCVEIIDLRFGISKEGSEDMKRFDAIAGMLGITADNARQRFGRCLSKLKKLISEMQMH